MKNLLLLSAVVMGLSGCNKIRFSENSSDSDPAIVSTRPQNLDQFITLIKLKTPPLLSQLKIENGKKKLDLDLAKDIATEQSELIAKLQKISSSIQVIYKYRLVINAISIVAPASLEKEISSI